ncbi:hypothetical protein M8C21_008078 [Ambrosia artemisiifolia]|uniref:RRM domain-containing protein n=1 Tax=Ambrosia artemisiifolia TaxID=4212 RepID=A0AAD5BPB5_AMBAR|nr:hypothetical protein M8C21_008078 [Ambrosia artemisiifolia]
MREDDIDGKAEFPAGTIFHYLIFIILPDDETNDTLFCLSLPPDNNTFQISVSMAATAQIETDVLPPPAPKSPSTIKTVEVSNVSLNVTEKDIWEFFSFSGNIHYIEMKSESETTKHAFVTFKESQGANTAALLTGATIGDKPVSVSHVEKYQLPAGAPPLTPRESQGSDRTREVAQKAEEVVSTMLAKGYVLGKDALQKAKSFDEKHQLTSNASATVASIDRKMGLTQKLSMGTTVVNEKVKEVDERYQVSETTKSAIAVAEKKANNAGSALMRNKYVSSGAVWIAGAFAAIIKAAEGVGSKTKAKVNKAEEKKERSKTIENEEKEGSKTKGNVNKSEEGKEGSKTKEIVNKSKEEKEGSKTKESADKSEAKEGSKTKESADKSDAKEGSKTIESTNKSEAKEVSKTKESADKSEAKEGSKTNESADKSEAKDGSKTKESADKSEAKEGSKTKEGADKSEAKEGSKTKEGADKSEAKEGSKTKEGADKSEENEKGSKTTEKIQKAEESSKKDSPAVPVEPSNNNNNLPKP